MPFMLLPRFVLLLYLALAAQSAPAAPFTPSDAKQVLERVPVRAGNLRARELQALRAAVQREPRNADVAAQLARRWVEDALADGDPRFVGYAQAALALWWNESAPPPAVRVQRAVVHQYEHRFAEALADLSAVTAAEPDNAEAWAWQAAIHMVRADYQAARTACEGLAPLTTLLTATACEAYVDSLTGRAAQAASERSDVTAVPAMGVIAEALVAVVLADAMLEKFGGDSLGEMRRNYDGYVEALGARWRALRAADTADRSA